MTEYIIFDIDGCISDDRPRRDLLPKNEGAKNGDYDEYHCYLYRDSTLNEAVLHNAIRLQREKRGVEIVFITARPAKFESQTRSWFGAHFGAFDYDLWMRPDENFMPSPELKLWLIDQAQIPLKEIRAAYDDRTDVLVAYDKAGITGVCLLDADSDAVPAMAAEEIAKAPGSKQEAVAAYKDEIAWMRDKTFAEDPRVTIFGVGENNIGEAIGKHLLRHDLLATTYTEEEIKLPFFQSILDADVYVFNNGVNHLDWIENWPEDEIENVVMNCLTATMRAVQLIAKRRMNSQNKTKIIFIGSMAHKAVLNGSAPYCAAKAGLMHFARCIAYELAPKGFEVYTINPSNVQDAPMSEATIQGLKRYRNLSDEVARAYWGAECPMGEFLTKTEIAETVLDLIQNDRKYLSGAAIDLIGGQR